jgi:glutathionylspermidine synthase
VQREYVAPRPDWQAKIESVGMDFHSEAGQLYWCEEACYSFTASEVDLIEEAADSLHGLCLEAADRLISAGDLERLSIPEEFWPWIAASWRRRDPGLYGRFDLVYDATGIPKMLEYNADTPTALLEAAVVQWFWLEEAKPDADQFNSIHERLIEGWKRVRGLTAPGDPVHFAGVLDEAEDLATIEYMRDVCRQADFVTERLDIAAIGWNGQDFTDLSERPIRVLFKLYPWEWLLREDFAPHFLHDRTAFIEAPWKMVLSNKAILPILWEMFPGHPNLLAASFERSGIAGPCAEKPIHGREGEGIRLLAAGEPGTPGQCIWQAHCPLPAFAGRYPVVGAWVIDGKAAGMGIREDSGPITGNTSLFLPHYFR